ncbi:hypothetical protein [Haploplasma axanthum]|uniref:Uncharacterized protein n=1 Tax=Haploplasma axanthum TaxID=29552 RepID=A0A449BDQ9_HAPAX|nr:hypothetical protein [Haploplasma axanthum]VEU80440.1 Uncharacterised protein [Haploplasma axanthum]
MLKKITISTIICFFTVFFYYNVKAYNSENQELSTSSLEINDLDTMSEDPYYYPEHWEKREQSIETYKREEIYIDYFRRWRPPFYWNYHRITAYEEGYKDTYVTSSIATFRVGRGKSVFTVSGDKTIAKTVSHEFSFSPEVKDISLGGYTYTNSTTVSSSIGASWTVEIMSENDSAHYGFYTISDRTKYSIYHDYSESDKTYSLVYNHYPNLYTFSSNRPDIIFLYTGNKNLV